MTQRLRYLSAVLTATFALGSAAVQLLPFGEFAARDGRPGDGKTWKLDNTTGRALAARLNASAAQNQVVIDYDHQTLYTESNGQKALAAGWISRFEWRDSAGLFGQVSWTPAATQHINDGEYKYLSPVITYDRDSGVITGLQLAALVNYPGLIGMEPVVAHLSAQFTQPTLSNDPQEHDSMNPILAALLAGLGLPETATQEQAVSALAALKAKPVVGAALSAALGIKADAPEQVAVEAVTALKSTSGNSTVAIAALQQQIATLQAGLNSSAVQSVVDAALAARKLLPAQRDWAMSLGKADPAQLNAFLASAPVMDLGRQTTDAHEGNGGQGADALSAVQRSIAKQLGLNETDFAKHLKATEQAAA
jgi:phage I-like protein